ncbi:MAG: serine protease [Bacteroidetes bacterium]|nr:serine protease [Bacteroidota bacterium]
MKLKKITLLFLSSILMLQLYAQEPATCFRIQLKDKNQSPYSITRPDEFLSPRAINNKARYNIPITVEDLPVNPQYKQQICALDATVRILSESKWQNTVVIYCPDSSVLDAVKALPFTDTTVIPVSSYVLMEHQEKKEVVPNNNNNLLQSDLYFDSLFDYGPAWAQIAFHNGHRLHELGFYGDDMLIVVMDGGWEGFSDISYFRTMYENGQLVGTRDLIPDHDNVYEGGTHGTKVTSIMATSVNGTYIGAAPHARYYFILSENPFSEELIEEDFWAQGIEIADSLGADVVNSSLGYSTFPDFPQGNFTYQSCDGMASIASRNASLACQKGIAVCVSAGNEGNNSWHYITHPADAFDVLTVGAARAVDSAMGPFSSYGPSADGRVKPDVTSVGWDTFVVNLDESVAPGSGTSFASPVMAGLTACLRQALPHKNALEIMDIIRQHGHRYNTPDTSMGYGIPDMYQAYLDNVPEQCTSAKVQTKLLVYPNPCTDKLVIPNPEYTIQKIEIYDVSGKLIYRHDNCGRSIIQMPVNQLIDGLYIVKIFASNGIETTKIIKR